MAQFRRNYSKTGNAAATMVRVSLLAGILVTLIYLFYFFAGRTIPLAKEKKQVLPNYLPASSTGQIAGAGRYWISWDSKEGLAEWAACLLTSDSVGQLLPNSSFSDADFTITSGIWDTDSTEYVRASLFPTASDSILKDNEENLVLRGSICPQIPEFQGNVWRDLQQKNLRLARGADSLFVISGPVLVSSVHTSAAVPEAYFQVLLAIRQGGNAEAIGFIVPHKAWSRPQQLLNFAVSVNEVEKVTGLDFFPKFLDDTREEMLESNFNLPLWEEN